MLAPTKPRRGPTKRAKTLRVEELQHLLHVAGTCARAPLRDYTMILLSFKAGLRANEIAGLDWADVTDARGRVGQWENNPETGELEAFFVVPGDVAKRGHYRCIPMHDSLRGSLEALHASLPPDQRRPQDPVIRALVQSDTYPRLTSNAVQMYLGRLYRQAGFVGCSSHSGRRTLITAMVRNANQYGCSLKDAQAVAGHKDIESTEAYIDASPFVGRMIRGL